MDMQKRVQMNDPKGTSKGDKKEVNGIGVDRCPCFNIVYASVTFFGITISTES